MSVRKIKYIGAKESKADNVAGTGLVWRRGEVLPVPASMVRSGGRTRPVWSVGGAPAVAWRAGLDVIPVWRVER